MLLKGLIDFIAGILDTIVRLIVGILRMLWLWIPMIFALVYVTVCFFGNISIVDNRKYLMIGLLISCGVSFICILKYGFGKKIKKNNLKNNQNKNTISSGTQLQPQIPIYNVQQMYPYSHIVHPSIQPQPQTIPDVSNYQSNATSDDVPLMENIAYSSSDKAMDNYDIDQFCSQNIVYPLIFASRRDPNVFVQEYSDRLIFLYREGRNLFNIGTQFKE